MLAVTNNSGSDYQDRYNGQDYVFPNGKTIAIPEEAAHLIFGYGDSDKTRALSRNGWMQKSDDLAMAMRRLGAFVFAPWDAPVPGEIIDAPPPLTPADVAQAVADSDQGQGSAPLQPGADSQTVSDGAGSESATDPAPVLNTGSILDRLG